MNFDTECCDIWSAPRAEEQATRVVTSCALLVLAGVWRIAYGDQVTSHAGNLEKSRRGASHLMMMAL